MIRVSTDHELHPMRIACSTITLVLVVGLLPYSQHSALAQDQPATTTPRVATPDRKSAQEVNAAKVADRPEDRQAIQKLNAKFQEAFNSSDVQALIATFTSDARIDDGNGGIVEGRDAIVARFQQAFETNPGGSIKLETKSLDFLSDDAAIEEGVAVVTLSDSSSESSSYRVIHVRKNGEWLQSRILDQSTGKPTPHEELKPLAFLVGDWVDESEDALVTTTCRWTDNQNFLVRDFTIKVEGKPLMSGSQRIGWDPLSGQIRSWVFDSEGGYGSGLWTRDGSRWIIKASGVRPDGTIATATQVLTYVNNDRMLWESVDRTQGDQLKPDIAEYALVRKPPVPKPSR